MTQLITTAATAATAATLENLSEALYEMASYVGTAEAAADRLDDDTLALELGSHLTGLRQKLALIQALVAKASPLPAAIVETRLVCGRMLTEDQYLDFCAERCGEDV